MFSYLNKWRTIFIPVNKVKWEGVWSPSQGACWWTYSQTHTNLTKPGECHKSAVKCTISKEKSLKSPDEHPLLKAHYWEAESMVCIVHF